jgi:hypothetical protein
LVQSLVNVDFDESGFYVLLNNLVTGNKLNLVIFFKIDHLKEDDPFCIAAIRMHQFLVMVTIKYFITIT